MSNILGAVLLLASLGADYRHDLKQLDQLLAWHEHYGLPLPPQNAELVQVVTIPVPVEAFSPEKAPARILAFRVDGNLSFANSEHWKGQIASVKGVAPAASLVHGKVFAEWLDVALVARERGWEPLALAAFRRWKTDNEWPRTEKEFATRALWHWKRSLHATPDVPLTVVAKYLRRVLRTLSEDEFDPDLLRSVELALQPRNAPPGSDEALVDDLVNVRDWPNEERGGYGFQKDPRYRAVVRRGLAVVPELVAHLDDDRITRAGDICNNTHRVKFIAKDILEQLNGGTFFPGDDDERTAIAKWFADANKLGEEKYLMERLFSEDVYFPDTVLWLLAEKYPQRLSEVAHKFFDKVAARGFYAWNSDNAWYFSKAVAGARISDADKRTILEYAARHTDPVSRTAGIYYLRPFSPKLAKNRLLRSLSELETEPMVPQRGFRNAVPQYSLAKIVAEGTDPEEWKALALAVRRANVADRIEFLGAIASATTPHARKHRLAFLADYLTDDDALVDSQAFGANFPRLEVRNAVAVRLADLFQFDTEEQKHAWDEAEWRELRTKVRTKVQEEMRR
ncbi:hypothetical protein [Frigoriglobus tundricola]|uniref:Uncharacterized protein n=1 Tax=Frigoriglobus tundricola TaxID=2774151 RepID=A0A6M5YIB3_9BACT|nr:hypothetical protein [Frigoriglobus tundricola]QJW93775.1 hypothetical protein FTUN_1286 [Frigoriglobus tundricola]